MAFLFESMALLALPMYGLGRQHKKFVSVMLVFTISFDVLLLQAPKCIILHNTPEHTFVLPRWYGTIACARRPVAIDAVRIMIV